MSASSNSLVSVVNIAEEYAGDTITRRVTVKDSAGSAINITGYGVRVFFEFSKDVNGNAVSGQSDVTLTVVSGVALTTPASGIFDWTLSKVQSAVVSGVYNYAIKIEDAAGAESTIIEGEIELRKQWVD